MAKHSEKPRKPKPPTIAVDDFVLLGDTRASYPGDWYLGRVLWVGKSDLLVERSTLNGQTWRAIATIPAVRAVGTIEHLVMAQKAAREAVQQLRRNIQEAERSLGVARDALFAKLDELAAGGLQILPPNFTEIAAANAEIQSAFQQAYLEQEPA